MKKVIAALLVLAIATPALAATMSATQISGTEVKLSYNATGDPQGLIRAFGIDVTVTGTDVNIVDITNANVAYDIFPGSIELDAQGNISAPGDPVGSTDNHADTQPGKNSKGVTLEMASLLAVPLAADDLCVVVLAGCEDITLTVANNTPRGGVVHNNGAVSDSSTSITVEASTLDQAQYALWLGYGKPINWKSCCWPLGDVDNNTFVTFGDVSYTYTDWLNADTSGRSDADMNSFLTFGDVSKVYTDWLNGNSCP